jgi:hypothetical protein
LGRIGDLAAPIARARRVAAGIVQFGDRVLTRAQCKNGLRHPRTDGVAPDARQNDGGEHPDDHDHYHELHDSEPALAAIGSSHLAHFFLLAPEDQRSTMSGLSASSMPDRPPQNKPLISIMKHLDFHGKRIPDAATREPDFVNN